MSFASIVPGWLIGYLHADDGETCAYYALPVVSLAPDGKGGFEPVVMSPDGQAIRANAIPGRSFAVEPGASFEKTARAHAALMGRESRAAA